MVLFKRAVCFLFFISIFYSCKREGQKDGQILYKSQNKQWKAKSSINSSGDFVFEVAEIPKDYYFLNNNHYSSRELDSLKEEFESERIVEFRVFHKESKNLLEPDINSLSNQKEALRYFSFNIKKDFKVLTKDGGVIECSGVHFERSFNVAPYKKLLLYFDNIPVEDEIVLLYEDNFLGQGMLEFQLNNQPIKL